MSPSARTIPTTAANCRLTGAGADDGSVHRDPTLGGSTRQGAGEGLAILNPTDPVRPFFHDFGRVERGEGVRFAGPDGRPMRFERPSFSHF